MKSVLRIISLILAAIWAPAPAFAEYVSVFGASVAKQAGSEAGTGNQILLGATLLFMTNEATQGGDTLPGGTTLFSQANLQYNLTDYYLGFGLFYQQDNVGPSQTNHCIGGKAELNWNGYYAEFGYGNAQQTFVNRAVQSRSGTQTFVGGGVRVPFVNNLLYFDGGVRKKTTTYTQQNGVAMGVPLTEILFMPFIGMGLSI